MKKWVWNLWILVFLGFPCVAEAETPSAEVLLDKMDQVLQYDTRQADVIMEVKDSRQDRKYEMKFYGRGKDESAMVYLYPRRDKGTKMLKKGDNLWLYMPRAERVQRISGHMLRQGMMGSDISYEDMMDAAHFREQYQAKITGEQKWQDFQCWVMEATAKDDTVTYPKRKIWIDQKTYIPVKQELYALSGRLLKVWMMDDIRPVGDRPVAFHMMVSDQLRPQSKTELRFKNVVFGIALQDEIFSKRWLERR